MTTLKTSASKTLRLFQMILLTILLNSVVNAQEYAGKKISFDFSDQWEISEQKHHSRFEIVYVRSKNENSSEFVHVMAFTNMGNSQQLFDERVKSSMKTSELSSQFSPSKKGTYGKFSAWVASSIVTVNKQKYKMTMSSFVDTNDNNVLVTEMAKLNQENSDKMQQIRDSFKLHF